MIFYRISTNQQRRVSTMKRLKGGIVVLISFLLLVALAANAKSEWLMDDGIEAIVLLRIDTDEDAPYHEIDEGVYGFYPETGQWETAIDFTIPPYIWEDVYWEPGPMDADTTYVCD